MDSKSKEKDRFIDLENGLSKSSRSIDRDHETGMKLLEDNFDRNEQTGTDSSRKKTRRTAKKPPRPPKSPTLDAYDRKFLREISKFSTMKRARMRRMKALKRLKSKVAGYSCSDVCALIITVLFCIVIFWNGGFSKSSSSIHGSTEPSMKSSVEFQTNTSNDHPFLSWYFSSHKNNLNRDLLRAKVCDLVLAL